MKRIISALLVVLLFVSVLLTVSAETVPLIRDEADLLSDEEEQALSLAMQPICAYCTPVFWTTSEDGEKSTLEKAGDTLKELVGTNEGVIFAIDMAQRRIVIWSTTQIYHYITTDVANQITENTYLFATNGDYFGCAEESFAEIYTVLSGGSPRLSAFATKPDKADRKTSYGKWKSEQEGITIMEFFSDGSMTAAYGTEISELITSPGLYQVNGTMIEIYVVDLDGTIQHEAFPFSFDGTVLIINGDAFSRAE